MSLWSWLTGSSPAPPARVEPPVPASARTAGALAAVEKQPGDIVGSLNSMAFPQPLLYAALGGYASNTGVPVTPFTALQSAAVYGCTKCIGEDIGGLPLQCHRPRCQFADGDRGSPKAEGDCASYAEAVSAAEVMPGPRAIAGKKLGVPGFATSGRAGRSVAEALRALGVQGSPTSLVSPRLTCRRRP
jgi:hypothetical protein